MEKLAIIADKLGTSVNGDTFDFTTVITALGLNEQYIAYTSMLRTKYGIPQSVMDLSDQLEIIKDSYVVFMMIRMIFGSSFYLYARKENRYLNVFNPPTDADSHNPLGEAVRKQYIFRRKDGEVFLKNMYDGAEEISLQTFATYWACKYLNPSRFENSLEEELPLNELYQQTFEGKFNLEYIFGEEMTTEKYDELVMKNIDFISNFIDNEELHLEFLKSSYELMSAGDLVGITSVLYCNVMCMARAACTEALSKYGIDFFDLQYKKIEKMKLNYTPSSSKSTSSSSSSSSGVEKKK